MRAVRGFEPPPYPYARLARLADVAARHEGGMVDLSVGTPCDPPPAAVVAALAGSGSERDYPSSIGSEALRQAAAQWMRRRFGVSIDASNVAACVGTKELVASTAWFLRLRDPTRDTVIVPAIAYPTYAMGAQLAGCSVVTVDESPDGGVDLLSVSDELSARAVLVWLNSPSNPTGSLTDLRAAGVWGRAHGVPVFSDECYAEFTWDRSLLSTVLQAGTEGVVAVHSLSKRSNMAGTRVGFYAGDSEIVGYLSAVRQHAGLMVPGPVQAAAVAALEDDEHVLVQRERYLHRLERLGAVLRDGGLDSHLPAGGFYLWVPVPGWASQGAGHDHSAGAWTLTEALAEAAGVLVSPGDLYGEAGTGFVRVAAVQPDDRIELVGERLSHSSHPYLGGEGRKRSATGRR
ncbi:MAG: aminotransferase class I/II-fold pyridoxal phosphate-dependent enzyme [Acidimicrobiales bacterium]